MVTRLYLIRHGETEGADAKRYKGHIDVPLSEKGIKQMEQVAAFISERVKGQHRIQDTGYKIQDKENHASCIMHHVSNLLAVYTSDLIRAVKSAEIIAEPHGLKPIIMPELRERNFGIWEGMSFGEIKEKYPEEFGAWARNPLKFSPMQGESTIEVSERVINVLNKILNSFRGQGVKGASEKINNTLEPLNPRTIEPLSANNIAIVSHGGVNRVILCHFLGIPLENIFRIEQDYGAVNVIEFHDEYPVVNLINYTV